MFLKRIINSIYPVVFALEPLHGQLGKLNIATKISCHTTQSFEAQLRNFDVIAVTSAADSLKYLFKVLVWCPDQFLISWSECIIDFDLEHHAEMPTVLVDFLVPIDHGLEPALHPLDDTMNQKLVVISE